MKSTVRANVCQSLPRCDWSQNYAKLINIFLFNLINPFPNGSSGCLWNPRKLSSAHASDINNAITNDEHQRMERLTKNGPSICIIRFSMMKNRLRHVHVFYILFVRYLTASRQECTQFNSTKQNKTLANEIDRFTNLIDLKYSQMRSRSVRRSGQPLKSRINLLL